MILKGIMEINANYIEATLVENDFRAEARKLMWKWPRYEVSEYFN